MNKVLKTIVASLVLVSGPTAGLAQSAAQSATQSAVRPGEKGLESCSLTMGWELWEPYQYVDNNNKPTGFDIELISEIFKDMDCSLRFKEINWARGLVEVRSGKLDLLAHADYTEERSGWAHFSDSYRDNSQVLYVKLGDSKKYPFTSLESIIQSNFRLGVGRGVFTGDKFARLMENPEFSKHVYFISTDELQQYQMLQAGRLDGYVRSISAMESLQTKLGGSPNLEIHPLHILTSKQHVIFSRKSVSQHLVEKFNTSLKFVVSEGIFSEIERRFID